MNTKSKKLTSPPIMVRLTPREYKLLQQAAECEGRSKAGVLRSRFIKELQK